MIRSLAAARFALVLFGAAPLPALADVTAHYTLGEGKQVLTVEVDDGGNTRLAVDDMFSLIRRDGVDYVAIDMNGQKLVARLDDAIKAMKVQLASAAAADNGKVMEFAMTPGAAVTVAGYAANSWTFGPKDAANGKALDVALTDDGELAPVGAVMRTAVDAVVTVFGVMFPELSQFGPRVRELLAKGTVVRVAPLLELQSVDHKDIDAHHFDLPGPVTSGDDLMKALGPPPGSTTQPLQPLP